MPSPTKRKLNKNHKNSNKNTKKLKLNNRVKYFESLKYNYIEYNYIKSPKFKKPSEPLRAVVLDIDETLGTFLAFKKLVEDYDKNDYDAFVKESADFLTNPKMGASPFRPGIEKFLNTLYDLKEESGKINSVILYTNMMATPFLKIDETVYTRPQILSDIFDKIIDKKNTPLCDLIIFRKTSYPPQKYMKVIEDIYEKHDKDNKFVFFDDKPENILNTKNSKTPSNSAYGITEYKGRNTNKSFNNTYSSKGVQKQTVFDILEKVF